MRTLHAEPPPIYRQVFFHLTTDEQLRTRFNNLRKLKCCPVCARDASSSIFCHDHQQVYQQLLDERQARLRRERRCPICGNKNQRVLIEICLQCDKAGLTVSPNDSLTSAHTLYPQLLKLYDGES